MSRCGQSPPRCDKHLCRDSAGVLFLRFPLFLPSDLHCPVDPLHYFLSRAYRMWKRSRKEYVVRGRLLMDHWSV